MTDTVQGQVEELCPDCKGTGRIEYMAWAHAILEGEITPPDVKKSLPCPICGGAGRRPLTQ